MHDGMIITEDGRLPAVYSMYLAPDEQTDSLRLMSGRGQVYVEIKSLRLPRG